MSKRMVAVQVETKVVLRGWVLLPEDWEDKYDESELGEFLDVRNHYEDDETEIWDEVLVEVPDDTPKYDTTDWEFVKQHRVKEEE